MVPAHTKSLIDAVTGFTLRVDPEKLIQGYPFLQTLALWSANVRDEGAAAVAPSSRRTARSRRSR